MTRKPLYFPRYIGSVWALRIALKLSPLRLCQRKSAELHGPPRGGQVWCLSEPPGHHDPSGRGPNPYNSTKSTLPENPETLWEQNKPPRYGNCLTKVGDGKKAEYHRFQSDGNGNCIWHGSSDEVAARAIQSNRGKQCAEGSEALVTLKTDQLSVEWTLRRAAGDPSANKSFARVQLCIGGCVLGTHR